MTDGSPVQLPLGIRLSAAPSFENFVTGANAEAVAAVRELASGAGERVLYLSGRPGVGKSHLLQAACKAVHGRGLGVAYLPLGGDQSLSPRVLDGMEGQSLLCLDGVDAAAGDAPWEAALFHLYNRSEQTGARILVAGRAVPSAAGLELPDLATRLAAGPVFRLRELDDGGRSEALRLRARERGMGLEAGVTAFLMRRHARDMHSMMAFLDRLDRRSLEAQRRVTVPLVRALLEEDAGELR